MKQLIAAIALILCAMQGFSQQAALKGTVIDTAEKKNLSNSVIALLRPADSVLVTFARSDASGNFSLQKLSPGLYILMVTRPEYADYFDTVRVGNGTTDLGRLSFILKSQLLQEVIVSHRRGAIRIKGDTTEYVADSFKVAAGATVEDLLKKLPGIQVDKDGKITAQGETVQKVLVDGEEFFSDDPTIATRGLNADALDKVQVYDKKSDQAAFTGIDDGQKTKTIDLKLKENKKNGYFGKIEAGTDADKYWNNSAMFNAFKAKRKFSAFGIMSSTGKTGLDWSENMNYGGNSGMSMGSDDDGGMWISMDGDSEFGGGNYYGQGLPKGWAGGMHYSNKWNGDKMHLNSGYQFNKLNVNARGITTNQYILPDTSLFVYERGNSFNTKERHQLNATYEYQIDSFASVKITATGSTGKALNVNNFHSESLNNFDDTLSVIDRTITSDVDNKKFNSSLLWKQKFRKVGRTFSLSVNQNYLDISSTGFLLSNNQLYGGTGIDTTRIDQQKIRSNQASVINARVVYTEGLTKRSLLEFNYSVDNNHRQSSITTLEKDGMPDPKYVDRIDSLSNSYVFNVLTQAGGIAYRYSKPKKINVSFGINVSQAQWSRKNAMADSTTRYSFTNFYPSANMNWTLPGNGNLRLGYNGNTVAPSIEQIQPIQDNTDQLDIQIGNPYLKQSFRHNVNLGYSAFKFLSERYINTNFNFVVAQNDFSYVSTIDLKTGKRTTTPTNVNGNWGIYNWTNYMKKLKGVKFGNMGVGVRANLSYNHNYNFVDDLLNRNQNYSLGAGPSINFSKEKKIDIWMDSRFTHNMQRSSLRPDLVTKYWTQEHTFSTTVYLPWKLEIGSDVNINIRQKTPAFQTNNNAVRWNARIDRKLFKNDVGRIRFSAFDILNQNIDFNRDIGSNFISERAYDTMRRYFLLSFIWNFSKNGKPTGW